MSEKEKKWTLALFLFLLAGCSSEVRRGAVVSVDVISKDGKGYMVYGPVYSVTIKTPSKEQFVFTTSKKYQVGLDVCIEKSSWQTDISPTICPEEKP